MQGPDPTHFAHVFAQVLNAKSNFAFHELGKTLKLVFKNSINISFEMLYKFNVSTQS